VYHCTVIQYALSLASSIQTALSLTSLIQFALSLASLIQFASIPTCLIGGFMAEWLGRYATLALFNLP